MLTKKQAARIMADMKPLGQMLRCWRDELKLSQAEASRRCGVSAQHWGLIEKGERTGLQGSTFQKLADGTGIPLQRLILAADLVPEEEAVTA